ncbi:hypothetical protein ABW19_dt0207300 [Dactylella cylindrospora]|nr:hypothetical protein ABW19_dt0207300 [Dactylella cylindrospora]
MIRLGGTQILLTNRDVTRTLNPNPHRRQPTFLYTKGKRPLRSIQEPIHQTNASRPITSPSGFVSHLDTMDTLTATSLHGTPSSDWSVSTASDTDTLPDRLPDLAPADAATDGTDDTSFDFSFIDGLGLRQVISLESIDSFPYLPASSSRASSFRIHTDEEYGQEGSDDIPTRGTGIFTFSTDGTFVEEGEEDHAAEPHILVESLWGPNALLQQERTLTPPPQPTPSAGEQVADSDGSVDTGLFETPPRR